MGTAMNPERYLEPADLLGAAREASQRARASGALVPLDTRVRPIEEAGVTFHVRVSPNVRHKEAAAQAEDRRDPFAPPYNHDLFVGHLSATHAVLLNKYNVLNDHLLLITRYWAEQASLLTPADCEALLRGLAGIDGLAFYNGGVEAGASQPHKHLQLVPLPLAPDGPALPCGELLETSVFTGGVGQMALLPFHHAVLRMDPAWIDDPARHGHSLAQAIASLWRALGYDPNGPDQPVPYNLLATRRWLWLVPRAHSGWDGLPVNALGYAGGLIARDQRAFDRLHEAGPMRLLTDCAIPAAAS